MTHRYQSLLLVLLVVLLIAIKSVESQCSIWNNSRRKAFSATIYFHVDNYIDKLEISNNAVSYVNTAVQPVTVYSGDVLTLKVCACEYYPQDVLF
jgi:hypothetical protein